MKKSIIVVLLAAMLLTALSACGKEDAETPTGESGDATVTQAETIDPDAIVGDICTELSYLDGFTFSSSSTELGGYLDDDLIRAYYGDASDVPDFTKVSSYCVYIDESNAKVLTDVGVFILSDASYADTLMQYLQARIDQKIASAANYPDIDVDTLEKAVIKKSGDTVYYVVSADVDTIAPILKERIG